jgi:DNA invertase Pin-like site-specific DNA recombinase
MNEIAVYLRVSSLDQNLEGQKNDIERWLAGNRMENVVWYADKATGTNLQRPEFNRLQKDIFNGNIKTVIVWKLDRLSRNLQDGVNVLSDWLNRGVRVVSVTQQIDFNGSLGKLLSAVILAIAEMESETRRERQAVGIIAAKKRGTYTGRLKGTTKVNPAKAQRLRDKGLTIDEIAAALKISRMTVFRYLRNE